MNASKEQIIAVLSILKSMKACVDSNDTFTRAEGYNFNLSRDAGICWHLHAHTPPKMARHDVAINFLSPVFKEMGLDERYPVESKICKNDILSIQKMHLYDRDKYNKKLPAGSLRVELLNKLIEYFSKKVLA